tara:strand:- start:142 stop:531 length:390 start_codon:yes stop_codon:yes gene_type:complete
LSITSSQRPFRWVLLKHTDAPGDSTGIHFDLLLEDNEFCRTWRLSDIPLVDGPYVNSVHITPHKLYWLDVKKKVVSGNRGVATRVKQGIFFKPLPRKEKKFINLSLTWEDIESDLVIDKNGCKIFSKKL